MYRSWYLETHKYFENFLKHMYFGTKSDGGGGGGGAVVNFKGILSFCGFEVSLKTNVGGKMWWTNELHLLAYQQCL